MGIEVELPSEQGERKIEARAFIGTFQKASQGWLT